MERSGVKPLRKDRDEALTEQIEGEVNDLIIIVTRQVGCFHGDDDPGWKRKQEFREEAIQRISKSLDGRRVCDGRV